MNMLDHKAALLSMTFRNSFKSTILRVRITANFISKICLCVSYMAITNMAYSSDKQIPATTTVIEGCSIYFKVSEIEEDIAVHFRNEYHTLEKDSPFIIIQPDGFIAADELIEYMALQKDHRAVLKIQKTVNGETVYFDIDYDADLLSQEISSCVESTHGEDSMTEVVESPDAPIPSPTELIQQAEDLGINVDDFYACPCGESFSAVQMKSPPWKTDSLVLHDGLSGCRLRTNEKKNVDVISAGGSDGANQVNCWAKVGLHTQNQQTDYKPSKYPAYTEESLLACYSIIGAKARQWLKGGGTIEFIHDPDNWAKTRKTFPGSAENLQCSLD